VISFFLKMHSTGRIPITDARMTRFRITLDQGAGFVLRSPERMEGGEIFVPKIPSMRIVDPAKAIAPKCEIEIVGIHPGEKLHEVVIPEDDTHHTIENEDSYAILLMFDGWDEQLYMQKNGGRPCPDGFRYNSDTNTRWLTVEELRQIIGTEGLTNGA
jgi:UDP-N-acetylglucosamine 4,6-dehydratase